MIGRDAEVATIEDLLRAARGGSSGALLVSGEAGIGKTQLLEHLRETAADMRVLAITGAEAESHLAFAGLSDLLGPVLSGIDELPGPQADALRGALGLGPPVPGDRFTAYAGAFGVLSAAAEVGPLVCVVDDAHWLDAESLEALLFATRRIEAEGVAIVLAARPGVSEVIDESGLRRLELAGLGTTDAERLLRARAAARPGDATAAALVEGAAGNPLALIELAANLTADQLAGTAPLPDPLPVGPHLAEGLLRPLAALPDATVRALLIASADDGGGGLLGEALHRAGLSEADLEPARVAGVIEGSGAFRHPLLRAAVSQAAEGPDRRAAHRAWAEAHGTDPAGADQRAWHLALAAAGPDEAAAAELEQAGSRAAARGAHTAASEALAVAAALSTDLVERARRLLAAGNSALVGGVFSRATRLLDEAITLDADPVMTTQAMVARGYSEMFSGSARRAIDMLVRVADRLEAVDPVAAAGLLAQAAVSCQMRADVDRCRELGERADRLIQHAPPEAATDVSVAVVGSRLFAGQPATLDEATRERIERRAAEGDPMALFWAISVAHIRMLEERYDEALAIADRFLHAARAMSTPSALPLALGNRADILMRGGRLSEARASASEAVRIAGDTSQPGFRGYGLSVLARVEAMMGLESESRRHASAALENLEVSEADSLLIYRSVALGSSALGARRLDEARVHFADADERYHRNGAAHLLLAPYLEDLVETLLRLGLREEALLHLNALEVQADATATIWPAAAAARCRGLLAADDDFEEHFARALHLHARTRTPFERARTLLCLGERRRRARRVSDARAPLSEAMDAFEVMGATAWAEWARRELRATGAQPREPRPSLAAGLTPQEVQVALAAAGGATNREIATALLISPKTVEFHLGRVYGKLGVRSRSEVAGLLLRDPSPR